MALNNHVENFTLDMAPGGIAPVLNVSQGDTGRAYTADMYWGGASYDVSGLTVRLRGRKRDNTVFDYALPAPSGTKVAFDLEDKEQVTIIPGNVECELVFTDSNSRVVGTANFVIIVEESPYDPNAISESEVTGLVDLISDQIGGAVDDWMETEAPTSPEFAAAVSDAVTDYADENGLGDLYSTSRNINTANVGKYTCDSAGVIYSPGNNYYIGMDAFVPCESDTFYAVSVKDIPFPTTGTRFVNAYFKTENGEIISNTSTAFSAGTNPLALFKTPSNAGKIYVSVRAGDGFSEFTGKIQIEKGFFPTEYVEPITANDGEAREVTNKVKGMIEFDIPVTESPGYYGTAGGINSPSSTNKEVYTNRIDVTNFSKIYWAITYGEVEGLWACYAAYDTQGNFLERVVIFNAQTQCATGVIDVSDLGYISFSYRTFGFEDCPHIAGLINSAAIIGKIQGATDTAAEAETAATEATTTAANVGRTAYNTIGNQYKPCYDHLFVNTQAQYITIPHESVYHVRISRRLGFNAIEANVAATSDGVYITNHLIDGKFGRFFHHVDGTTDISDIALNSVTWAWVEQNVRYNSTIEKYRTRPCTLQEFLYECKQQNLLPFLGGADDANVVQIANEIMGKDNYIAYRGTRALSPSAIIYRWTRQSTKEAILAACEEAGAPFIYGMANPTDFTDEELKDITNAVHKAGFMIGTSYVDNDWPKYQTLGFDFNGTQTLINRIDVGNLHNINSIFGFSGFTYDNGTEANGVLTFNGSSNGHISPDIPNTTYELCGIDVEVWFTGTIILSAIGERASTSYTSDGTHPVYIATPIINGSPKFTLVCNPGTVVKDIKFKASVF